MIKNILKITMITGITVLFTLNLTGCGHKKRGNHHIINNSKSTFSSFKKEPVRGFLTNNKK